MDLRSLPDEVAGRYGVGPLPPPVRLTGGYANDVYRLGDVVVRLAPDTATEATLAYEHGLVTALAASVPEVKAPLRALDGSTFWATGGRLLSLWPWIPGRHGERRSRTLRLSGTTTSSLSARASSSRPTAPPAAPCRARRSGCSCR
jgi:Ser/Thr protein kinase RdoA (MazF antagonist)